MCSLSEAYHKLVASSFFLDGKPRPLIEKALEELEDVSKEGGLLALQLPTGYGKTAITYASFISSIIHPAFFWRVLHIAPLRTLIEDIYLRFQQGFERCCGRTDFLKELVGIQMMLVAGSPYFQKRLTVTTFDTLTLSMAKIPPLEAEDIAIGRGYGHFDIPRASVLESLVVMDEVHSFLSEDESNKALQVLLSIINYLVECRTPLVLMTATMPKRHLESMAKSILQRTNVTFKALYYGSEGYVDKEFENEQTSKNIYTSIVDGGLNSIVSRAVELASSYNRVLVVLNTISRAVEAYKKLKEKSDITPLLLHSKFKQSSRINKIEGLRGSKWILVSTQVIEVGVDVSADVLITDLAPANNLVQRAGRVARRGGEDEGRIVLVRDRPEEGYGYYVYDAALIKRTWEKLCKWCDGEKVKIKWRSLGEGDWIGYQELMDYVYSYEKRYGPDHTYYKLISSFRWRPDDAIKNLLYVYNGSFLRDSPMIPLLPNFSISDYLSFPHIMMDAIPVDVEDVKKMLTKKIAVKKCMVVKGADRPQLEDLTFGDLKRLPSMIMTGKLLALCLPPETNLYSEEVGLTI